MSKIYKYTIKSEGQLKIVCEGKDLKIEQDTKIVNIYPKGIKEICERGIWCAKITKLFNEYIKPIISIVRTIFDFIIKMLFHVCTNIAFPMVALEYIILLVKAFNSEDETEKFVIGLFMGILSIIVAVLYSTAVDDFLNSVVKEKIMNRIQNLMDLFLFAVSVFSAFGIWYILYLDNFEMVMGVKDDLGNLLTWLSLVIFFSDRIYSRLKDRVRELYIYLKACKEKTRK